MQASKALAHAHTHTNRPEDYDAARHNPRAIELEDDTGGDSHWMIVTGAKRKTPDGDQDGNAATSAKRFKSNVIPARPVWGVDGGVDDDIEDDLTCLSFGCVPRQEVWSCAAITTKAGIEDFCTSATVDARPDGI
jgi:hypothetical protein